MTTPSVPLLELFTRLRKADLPLGMDEYQLLLRALQAGFGIADRTALKRLCRILWVKSADEDRLFDYHFEQLMPEPIRNEIPSQPIKSLSEHHRTQTDTSVPSPPSKPAMFDISPSLRPSELPRPDTPPIGASETTTTSEMTVNIEDEVRVAQAVLQATSVDNETSSGRYISSDEYFPVTRRQMKQSWRYLRRPVREGPPVELDIEETVNEVGRQGILLRPILVPRRINRAELILLIDQGGSMVPFHMLSYRLIETVLRGGRLGRAGIYYFHNCPVEYLYRDPAHQNYEEFEEILNGRYSQRAGVLVFSDAGAARGGFSSERSDLTEKFLKQFKRQFRYIAWLNPVPRYRWPGTTAGKIMQSVPMFDLSRRGLDDVISVLRGHPAHLVHQ